MLIDSRVRRLLGLSGGRAAGKAQTKTVVNHTNSLLAPVTLLPTTDNVWRLSLRTERGEKERDEDMQRPGLVIRQVGMPQSCSIISPRITHIA